ncbi:hypothetical protein ON010_g10734 [Phytophthora cinnamomi]|nr:hypothetical protein ON010_g10734 [Phytophthora cinnamomi]
MLQQPRGAAEVLAVVAEVPARAEIGAERHASRLPDLALRSHGRHRHLAPGARLAVRAVVLASVCGPALVFRHAVRHHQRALAHVHAGRNLQLLGGRQLQLQDEEFLMTSPRFGTSLRNRDAGHVDLFRGNSVGSLLSTLTKDSRASSVDFTLGRSHEVNPPLPPPQEPLQRLRARSFSYSPAYGSSGYNPFNKQQYGPPSHQQQHLQQQQAMGQEFPQTLRSFHSGSGMPGQPQPPLAGIRPPRVSIPTDSPMHQYQYGPPMPYRRYSDAFAMPPYPDSYNGEQQENQSRQGNTGRGMRSYSVEYGNYPSTRTVRSQSMEGPQLFTSAPPMEYPPSLSRSNSAGVAFDWGRAHMDAAPPLPPDVRPGSGNGAAHYPPPPPEAYYDVEFKRGRQEVFAGRAAYKPGEYVKVEADRGEDIGRIVQRTTDVSKIGSGNDSGSPGEIELFAFGNNLFQSPSSLEDPPFDITRSECDDLETGPYIDKKEGRGQPSKLRGTPTAAHENKQDHQPNPRNTKQQREMQGEDILDGDLDGFSHSPSKTLETDYFPLKEGTPTDRRPFTSIVHSRISRRQQSSMRDYLREVEEERGEMPNLGHASSSNSIEATAGQGRYVVPFTMSREEEAVGMELARSRLPNLMDECAPPNTDSSDDAWTQVKSGKKSTGVILWEKRSEKAKRGNKKKKWGPIGADEAGPVLTREDNEPVMYSVRSSTTVNAPLDIVLKTLDSSVATAHRSFTRIIYGNLVADTSVLFHSAAPSTDLLGKSENDSLETLAVRWFTYTKRYSIDELSMNRDHYNNNAWEDDNSDDFYGDAVQWSTIPGSSECRAANGTTNRSPGQCC